IAVVREIPYCSRVRASVSRLQFTNDFHRPHLGSSCYSSRRKYRSEKIEGAQSLSDPADYTGHNVLHMAVTLNSQEFRNLDSAVVCNAAYVVSCKVNEHHMLGSFFLVVKKLRGKHPVSGWVRSERSRTGDRESFNFLP